MAIVLKALPKVSGTTFSSTGDPHVVTGDGQAIENQKTGRFTYLKSKSGDFQVEGEQSTYSEGTTVTTAIAIKIGKNVIKYSAAKDQIILNGRVLPLADGKTISLPGGGSISKSGSTFTATTPLGDTVSVTDQGSYLDVSGSVSARRAAGDVTGSLGCFDRDNDASNDMRLRNGVVVSDTSTFLESWRTVWAEDLFR